LVDGIQKRGVLKKKIGRICTVEYTGERNSYEPTSIERDQSMVHPL